MKNLTDRELLETLFHQNNLLLAKVNFLDDKINRITNVDFIFEDYEDVIEDSEELILRQQLLYKENRNDSFNEIEIKQFKKYFKRAPYN